jgi:hypothetical protein
MRFNEIKDKYMLELSKTIEISNKWIKIQYI